MKNYYIAPGINTSLSELFNAKISKLHDCNLKKTIKNWNNLKIIPHKIKDEFSHEALEIIAEVVSNNSDIFTKSRKEEPVLLRQMCFFLAYNIGIDSVFIGNFFDKNHATVLHGNNKIKTLISLTKKGTYIDKKIYEKVSEFKKILDI